MFIKQVINGYQSFRDRYARGDNSVMKGLAYHGQQPEFLVVSCCDSRVDPALLFECEPGDLFIVRNVANIVPPYENDEFHHGTSAALEFGICYLNIRHLVILGHSQCGGINALLNEESLKQQNDFIGNWVSLISSADDDTHDVDWYAQQALHVSYQNCLSYPWIAQRVQQKQLTIHRWFFDIKNAQVMAYAPDLQQYLTLEEAFNISE
jgi:carbonic anhydrase